MLILTNLPKEDCQNCSKGVEFNNILITPDGNLYFDCAEKMSKNY